MSKVYGVGDLRKALDSIGATQRQLSYLVAKDWIKPSVRMPGRLGYTMDDIVLVFLMLGPLSTLEPVTRRRVVGHAAAFLFWGPRNDSEFVEIDLEDAKQNRLPAIVLKLDRQEILSQFATFMAAVG